ncbi:tetratricopeptide repeat protein [Azospirillum sp. sgz302134]
MATIQEALLAAFDLQQAGRLAEADSIYGQILDALPDHPPTLHLRGLLLAQCERLEEAAALIARAVEADDAQPDYHGNLAGVLEALGRWEAALDHFVRAAALDPGRIDPLNNVAVRAAKAGRPDLAARALGAAVALRPLDPDLRVNLTQALEALGEAEAVIGHLRVAALLAPDDPQPLRLLAERLSPAVPDAARVLDRVLRLDPAQGALWNRLGNLHKAEGRLAEARHAYERGLAIGPSAAELWNNRSSVLKGQNDPAGALTALGRAAVLWPESPEIRNNQADGLMLAGRPADALDEAEAALSLDLALGEARVTRASALLALGRFEDGWDAWEDRWAVPPWNGGLHRFPHPFWTGEPLGEGRLLVWGEQGVGDEIQFASILPLLTQAGLRCLLECDARLAPLFARSLPGVEVVPRATPPDPRLMAPDIAAQIPAGSLPRLLLRAPADFRLLRPYLRPDPARADALRSGTVPGVRPLVGIAWHTTNPKWGRSRNIPLGDLARALHAAGARLLVLQYGDWTHEVAALAAEGIDIAVPPGLDLRDDLDGLAAQIAATDMVVTIDNVTAHMAGALGHPTAVLLSHAPDWRWLRDRADSPWYPSVTLFRQPVAKDWRTPLAAVTRRLCG